MICSDEELKKIKIYGWGCCGVKLCLEQVEIISMSLNNKKKYPNGWNEKDLIKEIKNRYER